ncbi:HAD family hydrolase [Candidatus Nitrospira bockiana]
MPVQLHEATALSEPARPRGAFFDVDNTLIPGPAIEVRFFHYLFQRGLIGLREVRHSLWHLVRHMPPVSLHPLRVRKLYLAGKQPHAIEPLAHEFVKSDICSRVSREGLAVLEAHRRAGHHLVLITGSLDFLIAPLAAALNVSTVLAARPERTPDGYTGHLLPPFPYGEGKRRLIEAFARQQRLDLQDCFAYGDSPGDVAVLSSVGHPHVINPIRGMARLARRRGWPVAQWL